MKLKYYLRGIGIGMIVTAVLFMLGGAGTKPMSDAEIIKRAKDLGLVENTVLKDLAQEKETDKIKEPLSEQETEISEEESEEISEPVSEEQIADAEGNSAQETGSEGTSESDEVIEEFVVIHIISGDSSVSVSQKVFEMGLVESAKEFDTFLCANGYERILAVGQHEVKKGATMQEIADALTRR